MLDVLIHGQTAGTVTVDRRGQAQFSYTDDYLAGDDRTPLSVGIPFASGTHEIEDWMDGLLSDNSMVRNRWASDYGITSTRPAELLATPVGRDCAGAVQFCPPEDTADVMGRGAILEPLSESDLEAIIAGLRADSAGWNRNRQETAFSLAGAQAKTALRLDGEQWSLPGGSACTTHILKPAAASYPDLDIVEHLCQRAASILGIQSATTECVHFGEQRALVVTRYDRASAPDGTWRRVHQEDMCQALGVPPSKKYQPDGGPTPGGIAGLIRRVSSAPDADVRGFLDGLVYNWLIANTDGHAKNYSLLIEGRHVRFAPLYDLCSMLPYTQTGGQRPLYIPKMKLAMKIGKEYTLGKAGRESSWARAANQLGIPAADAADRMGELSERLGEAFEESADTLPDEARASPYALNLHRQILKRAVDGKRVSLRLAATTRQATARASASELAAESHMIAAAARARCPHVGVRSKTQCVLRVGHRPPHRYT